MIGRIAVLGGSSVYIPEFVLSAVSHNLNVKEIVLIGREGTKLPIVAGFCQRLLDKAGYPTRVLPTTDIEEGVREAKYVLNAIRVGGMQARIRDEKLPPKYGMVGDESLGAGGFANAMRTLPVVFDMAERIQRVNPDTVFINLTNPMGVVVEALTKHTKLRVVGTCDLPGECVRLLAEILHHAPEDLWVDFIGLNHLGWIQDVKIDGRSYMGFLLDKLDGQQDGDLDYPLIELFRMIPVKTVSLYFCQDDILKCQQSCARFRAEILHEAERQILRLYQDERLNEVPELMQERNAVWYKNTIVPLVAAMEGRTEQNLILCVRNNGSIRDLPEDASVEIPVAVSRKGLKPHIAGSCPHFLKGLYISFKESDRLTIEAVRHKSYECALQALVINPLVPSVQAARKYLERIVREESLELH